MSLQAGVLCSCRAHALKKTTSGNCSCIYQHVLFPHLFFSTVTKWVKPGHVSENPAHYLKTGNTLCVPMCPSTNKAWAQMVFVI